MDSVKVAIRIRPLIAREQGSDILWTADTHQIRPKEGKGKPYLFDRVFDCDEITRDVYEEIVEPIVKSAMGGFNGTVFAYGQTSSGKTYTMMGDQQNPGIIPLSVKETFEHIQKTPEREFLFRVSYMEIYNEVVRDLLVLSSEGPGLQIREDEFRNAVVQGLTEKLVVSPAEVLKLMESGERRRHFGCTNMNERSSRSHTIFRMIIESRERVDANATRDSIETDSAIKVSQLNLVDLAGSERAGQTGAEGQRFKEGCHINKSLSTLGLVINQICKASDSGQSAQFISYRDSKLTRILQPSLGGNSLTAIICAVTPVSADDTDSTLRFASNAKKIKNKPHVNEVLSDEALLYRQKREINQLKKKIQQLELGSGKKQTAELESLLQEKEKLRKEQEEKIQMLKKIILVSTQPADSLKRQRAIRRETWCPGKLATTNRSPQPWRSPRVTDSLFLDQSTFFQKLDQTLMSSELEPVASKRARFTDNPSSANIVAMTPGTKQKADATANFVSLEEEVIQMRKRQEELEEELEKEQTNKNRMAQEKESLNLKVMRMQSQISAQRETLDEVLEEKNQLEDEKDQLQTRIQDQNQKITEYMRREKQWESSNPDARVLRNENIDLCDQLREVCAQNRKLQEKNDEDRDAVEYLQSTLEEISKDAKRKETSLEEYKQQVTALQNQLESSSVSSKTPSPIASFDAHKLEEGLKESKINLEKKEAEIKEQMQEILKLRSELENVRANSTSGGEDVSRILETLEEQMRENHYLKNQLNEKSAKDVPSADEDAGDVKILEQNLENVRKVVAEKEEEIASLHKLLEEKAIVAADKTVDESVKVGEKTFADYITACEALVEERNAVGDELKTSKEEIEKLRIEIDELKSSHMNDSRRFGEKTMMEALDVCETVTAERDLADDECKILKQQIEALQTERDQMKKLLADMKEQDEFVQAEKEVLFEQEKESLKEIKNLKEQLEEARSELLTIQNSNPRQGLVPSSNAADSKEVENLREEICNLQKSSDDSQEMLQEANKNLAISNSAIENQKVQIVELEKELKRVKSDVESFDTMAEMTKQKYDCRIEELTLQLQSAYDQLSDGQCAPADPNREDGIGKYKILLDQKETEIENLGKKLDSSSDTIIELQNQMNEYKKRVDELSESQSVAEFPEEDAILPDFKVFLAEKNLSLHDVKSKIEAVSLLEEETQKNHLDAQNRSQRIAELESALKSSQDEIESVGDLKMRISDLENMVSERDVKLEKFEEASLNEKLQENTTSLQNLLKEKESELASLSSIISEMKNEKKEKDDAFQRLHLDLELSSKKREELEKQLGEPVFVEDEKNLREMLANTRKELLAMTEKYSKLQSVTEHTQGALLAETNRDLDHQRLLQLAETQRRESELEIASERQSANKQISELLAKVNELQTALCKSNVDKDLSQRQSDKMTQECEFLRNQVKELENIHNKEMSVIPRGQAMDPDKMAVKIKQLTLNLELTKQTSDKLTTTNKKLQEENRKMESEMVKVLNLQSEVTRLSAILEQERKMRGDEMSRQNLRDKESSEMRNKIIHLQSSLKEAESDLVKKQAEASEILKSLSEEKKALQDEVGFLKEKMSSLEAVIQNMHQGEDDLRKKLEESQREVESLMSELDCGNSRKVEDQRKIESLEERLSLAVKNLEQEKQNSSENEKQKEDLISDLEKVQETSENMQKMLNDANARNELLQQGIADLKMKLDSAKQELEDAREEEVLDKEESQRGEIEKNLDELKVKLEEKDAERESLQQKLTELIEDSERKDSAKMEAYKELQDVRDVLIQERDAMKSSLAEMEDSSECKDAQLVEYRDSYVELQKDLQKAKEDNDSLLERISATQADSGNLEIDPDDDQKNNDELEKQMGLKMLQEQYESLAREKDSMLSRIQELEVALALKEEEANGILLSQDDSSEVVELQNKVRELEAELEAVILAKEEACRILHDAREDHRRVIAEIKEDQEKTGAIEEKPALQEEIESLQHLLAEKEEELKKNRSLMQELENKCSSVEQRMAGSKSSEKDDDCIGFATSLDQEMIENLQDQVAELKLELEDKKEIIEDLKKSLESGDNPSLSVGENISKEQEEIHDFHMKTEGMPSMIQAKDSEIPNLLQASNGNSTSVWDDTEQELADLKNENVSLTERILELQRSSVHLEEVEEMQRKLDEASSQLKDISSLKEENQILNQRILSLESLAVDDGETSLHQEEVSILKKENSNLNERIIQLQQSYSDLERDLEDRMKGLYSQLEEKDSKILELNQLVESTQSNTSGSSNKEEEIKVLKRQLSDLRSLLPSENEEMAEMKQQLLDLSKSLEKEDSRIVELKKTKEDAEIKLQKSKEECKILLEKIEGMQSEVERFEEENEKLNTQVLKLEKESQEEKIKLQECISSLEKRIRLLEGDIDDSKHECESLRIEVSDLNQEKENLEKEGDDLRSQLQSLRSENIILEKDENPSTQRISELEADVLLYKEKASALDEQLNSVYAMIQEKASLMEESASSREAMEKDLENLRSENSDLKAKLEEWEEKGLTASNGLQENAKKMEESVRQQVDEASDLAGSKDSLISEIDRMKKENSTLEREIQEAVNRIQELDQEVVDVKDERDSLKEDKKGQELKIAEMKEEAVEVQESVRHLEEEAATLKKSKDSLERCLNTLKEENAMLEKKINVLSLDNDKNEKLNAELEATKASLETALTSKDALIQDVKDLKKKMEDLSQAHEEQIEALKSSQSKESPEVEELKEKLASDKKEAEKILQETRGLLYKKELEVQTLESEISDWEKRYEDHKSAFDSAVKTTKEEIASVNEKHSVKLFELEEELRKSQDLNQKLEAFSSSQEEKMQVALEKEREGCKKLEEKLSSLEEEFTKTLKEAKDKAKMDQNRLLQKIDSLEDGLFESDKELEEEKEKREDLEKKLKEAIEKHERSGATRTRGSEKSAHDIEVVKESLTRAETKCKAEKQRSQQLATQLKAEKQRCTELVARMEDMAVKQQSKLPGVDMSDAARELFMEREKNKELSEKLSRCDADFSKKINDMQERMNAQKKKNAEKMNRLQDNIIESETELEDEKKKTENLEKQLSILDQKLKAKDSSSSTNQHQNLEKKVEEQESQISRLEIKLKSNVEPLEREISQLKEELKMSEERVKSLKQQFKVMQSDTEGSATRTHGRTTRSATASGKSLRGGSGGVVVQDTKVYVLEMEISEKQMRIKYLEKELAKYKDIETKRRSENMELLEENKKYRTIIKKAREKKHSSSDVLSENSAVLNMATPQSAINRGQELSSAHASQEDKCISQ